MSVAHKWIARGRDTLALCLLLTLNLLLLWWCHADGEVATVSHLHFLNIVF